MDSPVLGGGERWGKPAFAYEGGRFGEPAAGNSDRAVTKMCAARGEKRMREKDVTGEEDCSSTVWRKERRKSVWLAAWIDAGC